LVVGVASDSNKIPEIRFSADGGRMTLGGGGSSTGHTIGVAGLPLLAQPEIASVQVSHNSIRDGLGGIPIFLMGLSDVGQLPGLCVLRGSGVLHCLGHCGGVGRVALGRGCLSAVTTP